jgi:SAM-dependent methyltransferase
MDRDYSEVTEIVGEPISLEQRYRLHHRYTWAARYCRGVDVVECGCGTGPGLGLLASAASSFEAGDISAPMVDKARRHYGERCRISEFDAQSLPFADRSKDVVLLFEALYYLDDAQAFVRECRRVLRPGGRVLIVTANKDLWDFHPSPHAHAYYGVRELDDLFTQHGFDCEFFGFQDVRNEGMGRRALRPIKRLAVQLNLIPKTMAGKRWLKRIVFGGEVPMPAELSSDLHTHVAPAVIPAQHADTRHRIIYCAARLRPNVA